MERKIKFRAWDNEWGKIHKVSAVFYRSGGAVSGIHMFPANGIGAAVVTSPYREGKFLDPLMQFTGQADKNGKEIFEGDLIECAYCKDEAGEVVWNKGMLRFQLNWSEKACANARHTSIDSRANIVGNIYENPELLQE